jgi:hypothetical protein
MTVTVPGLGTLTNEEFDWLVSEPLEVQALGSPCRFTIDGFDPSWSPRLAASVERFRSLSNEDLRRQAGDHVWAYYRDLAEHYGSEPGFPAIPGIEAVWDFVTLGNQVWVQRDEAHWYLSIENECAWEPEHGLNLVFKDGGQLVRVGQVDGHLTNRSAFADDSIPDDTVYVSLF